LYNIQNEKHTRKSKHRRAVAIPAAWVTGYTPTAVGKAEREGERMYREGEGSGG